MRSRHSNSYTQPRNLPQHTPLQSSKKHAATPLLACFFAIHLWMNLRIYVILNQKIHLFPSFLIVT